MLRRTLIPFLLALASLTALAEPQGSSQAVGLTQWRTGLIEINEGWAAHEGDDLSWMQPAFDDSAWQTVDLEDMGSARPGTRWFRKRIHLGPDHANSRLLISGGDGTYELFVNGSRIEGPGLKSAFNVKRPTERVFKLSDSDGMFAIALRTRAPANYGAYHLPVFLSITLGGPTAVEYERQALESERMYALIPSLAINLLLCVSGLAGFGLYRSQRGQREYLFLGLYLFTAGASNCLWIPQQEGLLPTSANYWIADPLIFVFAILQIEFTYSFARVKPGRAWRLYERVMLAPIALIPFVWSGHFSFDLYALIEAIVILPAGLLLPVMLFLWWRRGNREAAWLILPSLLPTFTLFLFDLGGSFASIFGWSRFAVLLEPFSFGQVEVQTGDVGNLIFLFAMAFVMFHRYTRVSGEQARANAEFEAAREVQMRLVRPPAALPGFRIETAYLPAAQVGGDFYFVRPDGNGGVHVVLGDVSGKGLRAALAVSAVIGVLRTLSGFGPGQLLRDLNRGLSGEMHEGFVTCCALHVDSEGSAAIANAGHIPPWRNGKELACANGLPLGILAESGYEETTFKLEAGDKLTLITDGVVEAQSASGELFGFDRATAIAMQSAQSIADAAQRFGLEDDLTVLTLQYAPV